MYIQPVVLTRRKKSRSRALPKRISKIIKILIPALDSRSSIVFFCGFCFFSEPDSSYFLILLFLNRWDGPALVHYDIRDGRHKRETQVFYLWVAVAFLEEEVEVTLTAFLTAVFKVATLEVVLLLELEDLAVEAAFCATLTLAVAVLEVEEAVPEEISLAPLMPLDLTTEPTDFFM